MNNGTLNSLLPDSACRRFLPLLLAASVGLFAHAPAVAKDYLESAGHHLSAGEPRAAVIELKNAVLADPKAPEPRLLLGTTYLRLGLGEAAGKECARARENGAQRDSWLVPLGRALLLQGQPRRVLDEIREEKNEASLLRAQVQSLRARAYLLVQGDLDREKNISHARRELAGAIALAPDDWLVTVGRVYLALFDRDLDAARGYAATAVELAPAEIETWLLYGDILVQARKADAALKAYGRALDINPDYPLARVARARVYLLQGQAEMAEKDLAAARHVAPGLPQANYLSGVLSFRRDDLESADAYLQRVLQAVPGQVQSQLLLGSIYFSQQRYRAAEDLLQNLARRRPELLPATKLLARTRSRLGDNAGALQALEPLANSDVAASDAQYLVMLGNAYLQTGNHEKANHYLEQATTVAPDAEAVRMQLALSHLVSGAPDRAVDELERTLEAEPDNEQAATMLVRAHLRNRDFDEAVQLAQGLVEKQPDNPVLQDLLAAAYFGKGDTAQARKHLSLAQKIDPGFIPAYLNLARLELSAGDRTAAREYYESALAVDPVNLDALQGLTMLLEEEGDKSKALQTVERAADSNPDALQPVLRQARQHLRNNDSEKALTILSGLERKHPDDSRVLLLLGTAQMQAGYEASAESTFTRLVRLAPDRNEAYFRLARAQEKRGEGADARRTLESLLQRKPDDVEVLATLAALLLRGNELEQALTIAQQIQTLQAGSPLGYRLEGDVQVRRDNNPKALAAYERAYETRPGSRLATTIYRLRARSGQVEAARTALIRWLEIEPEDVKVRIQLAMAYQQAGEPDRALAEYEKVRRQQPNSLVTLNNLAWLYHERKDPLALNHSRHAYELKPEQVEVADTHGWMLLHYGNPQEALRILQDTKMRSPTSPDILYHYAVALQMNGKQERARKELERLLTDQGEFGERSSAEALLAKLQSDR